MATRTGRRPRGTRTTRPGSRGVPEDIHVLFRRAGERPESDDGLEFARRVLEQPGNHRFERLQATIIEMWAEQIASAASSGSTTLERDEVLGEARLWLVEQLKAFRPVDNGGNVGAFIRTRQSWFCSQTRRSSGGRNLTHGQFAVLGAIGRVREEHLNTEHREPTGSELRDKVTELLVAQTRGKILDKPDGSGAKLDDAQLDAAITRKLTKDGIAAALADFDAVRLESLPVLGLVESDDENVWNVPPLTVDEPDADAGDPERKFEELLRVALGDQHWARAALQADDPDTHAATAPGGATPRTLRETLARARGRVTAPHAQFAHLAAYRVHDS